MEANLDLEQGLKSARAEKAMGLRWRIVAVLLIASLLPLALLGIGAYVVFGGLLEQKALELNRNLVQHHASTLDRHLAGNLLALEVLASTEPLAVLSDRSRLEQRFKELNRAQGGAFVDLGVIDQGGSHLAYVGPYSLEGRNYASTEWFRTVLREGTYVSDVFLGFRQVPHCIVAVKRLEGETSWILRATINSDQFTALVRTTPLGSTGDVFIVNREGVYQTEPRGGHLMEPSTFGRPEPHDGILERRVIEGGKTYVQAMAWINSGRWLLVVSQQESEILEPLQRAMLKGALVVGLAVVLLVVATLLATGHLSRQIDRANAAREELSRALMRSARLASLGELATGLAHEINNPLAIISAEQTNIADVAGLEIPPSASQEEILESVRRCQRQILRCRSITQKMLQFGRKQDSEVSSVDVVGLISEIIALLKRQAEVRNIELSLETRAPLPNLMVDPTGFEQVVANLVNNALDALEDKPGGGAIRISTDKTDTEAVITVEDNGSGIAPEVIDQIFLPFFTTKPVGKGTGLGLSVCYGLVRSWNGRLEARSQVGEGTAMVIHLPLS